jgi:hypothetical protein
MIALLFTWKICKMGLSPNALKGPSLIQCPIMFPADWEQHNMLTDSKEAIFSKSSAGGMVSGADEYR